jgi:hypothetical protein
MKRILFPALFMLTFVALKYSGNLSIALLLTGSAIIFDRMLDRFARRIIFAKKY